MAPARRVEEKSPIRKEGEGRGSSRKPAQRGDLQFLPATKKGGEKEATLEKKPKKD